MKTRLQPAIHSLLVFLLATVSTVAHGQTTAFTYQGELNASGELADGNFDLRFGLFPAAAGGAQIGGDQTVSAVPVSEGIFTVQLDFGISAFPGANRFLEISVRPAGNGSFTALAPRQQISSTPYAIRTLSAATADGLSSACVGCVKDTQIENVSGSKVSGAIPAASVPSGSGNYIQNTTAPQANASFNVAGNGIVDGVLSAGRVGVGTATPATGVLLEVDGPTRVAAGGSGGFVQFSTPGGESGMSIIGATNRADLRFNDTTLKLVAGPGAGPPGPTSGIVIHTAGQVGIGTETDITGRLNVASTNEPGIRAISANRAVWGSSTGSSRGVYGDSVSGEGVHGESVSGTGVAGITGGGGINSPGVFGASSAGNGVGIRGDGTTGVYGRSASTGGIGVTGESVSVSGVGVYGASPSGPGVWGTTTNPNGFAVQATNMAGGAAISAQGHALQSFAHGGFVKVMLFVDANGTILRCFNSQASGAAVYTPPCGWGVADFIDYFQVYADSGVRLTDRFISVTPFPSGTARTGANVSFESGRDTLFHVEIFAIDDPGDSAEAPFMVFIF